MMPNQGGVNPFLSVPDHHGYNGSRRGSDGAFTYESGDTGPGNYPFSTQDPFAEASRPTSLPSSLAYSPSSQLDHLSHELQFFETRLNGYSFQYTMEQLRRIKGLLQRCLTEVDNTIGPYLLPQNPVPTLPAPASTSSCSGRYRCLLCPIEEQSEYSSTGTFRRHVGQKHCPKYEYRCHVPGCTYTSYRKDKMNTHRSKQTGHIMSGTLSPSMTGQLVIPMPTPKACWLCPKAVRSWAQWFSCIANHCRLPSTESDPYSRRGSRDQGNNNGDNGGSGGGDGNVFDRAFLDHVTGAMGAQFDLFSGNGFSGTGGNYHCAGETHSFIKKETSEDGTSPDGSSLAGSDAEGLFGSIFSSEAPEPQAKEALRSGLLHTSELLSINLHSRRSNLEPHVSETKRPSPAETNFPGDISEDQPHSEQALVHMNGDAGPSNEASASTHLVKSKRRPTLRAKAKVIRVLLVLQSAAARSRQVTEVTDDVDISVLDPKPNYTWLPEPSIDFIVIEPQWFLKQLVEPFLAECDVNEKSSPFWLAASRFLESIATHE